ncbi:unnamed protein product [Rotaria socialis]|uniref:Uncharacterized protein n=1 Tax=Rotaria socialis TaxID=392032 RepID=A0A817ZA88_9BILA|nr:unnamed protein product [Rotaria socialis]CAF4624527.1 unnamed protein product [Rotaria socialis]
MGIDCSTVTRIEDLSVGILIEFFDYFTAAEIYLSFSQVNSRLKEIIKSLPYLTLMANDHLETIISFSHSFTAIHFDVRHLRGYRFRQPYVTQGGNCLLQAYPSLDSDWYPLLINELENIICPDICSQLRSLILPASSSNLVQFIFSGHFPHLEICHLGRSDPVPFSLSVNTRLENLQQLAIRQQYGNEFEKILSLCPSLDYLVFLCDDVIPHLTLKNGWFLSMIYVRLGRLREFLFHNGQFDFLFSLFFNLREFHIVVNQCRQHLEIIEFEEVANIICHRLPSLKILDLRIFTVSSMRYTNSRCCFQKTAQMHRLLNIYFNAIHL